jgi:hypothetical protein
MNRSLKDFLADHIADDGTPLMTTGRLILDSEFGSRAQARTILSVIGEGFRKRGDIAAEVGVDTTNLKPPLDLLITDKRVVEGRRPLSAAPSRDVSGGCLRRLGRPGHGARRHGQRALASPRPKMALLPVPLAPSTSCVSG